MAQAFMTGAITLKAPRPSPGRGINPSGRMMRAMERDVERRIARALDQLRRDLMRGVTDANVTFMPLRLQSDDVIRPFADAIIAALTDVALAGSDFGREQVERFILGVTKSPVGWGTEWELANLAAEKWARQYGYDLVRGLLDTTRERLRGYIGEYAQNSEAINQLGQRIAPLFGPSRARTIAVTEVTRSFAEGNTAAWRQSGLIERRRWNTANDELVCPICGPLHRVTTGINESFPGGIANPPAHPNCRCWVTPVVEEVVEDTQDSVPDYQEPWRGAAVDIENKIINQKRETAAIIDNQGNIVFTKDGTRDSVIFTDSEIKQMKGNILTHNHPWGSSFSDADIAMVAHGKLKEIRAVGTDYTGTRRLYRFIVENEALYNYSPDVLVSMFNAASEAAKTEVDKKTVGRVFTQEFVDELNMDHSLLRMQNLVDAINRPRSSPWVRYVVEIL